MFTRSTAALTLTALLIGLALALPARAEDEVQDPGSLLERLERLEKENATLRERVKQLEERRPMRGPRAEGPRPEGPRPEGPRDEGARLDGPRPEGPRARGPRREGPRADGPRGRPGHGPQGQRGHGRRGPGMRGGEARSGPRGPMGMRQGGNVEGRLARIKHMLEQLLQQRRPGRRAHEAPRPPQPAPEPVEADDKK